MATVATQQIDIVIAAKDMYSSAMKKADSDFKKFGKSVIAMAAGVTAAIFAMRKAWSLAADAAKFDQQEQAFTNLAASHGANAQTIIDNLKRVSGQTVSTAAAIDAAGKAMLLGIPAGRMSELMEIARASAKITGQSVQQAFNDIAVGIGRQSPMILDNLGITVKLGKAYDDYALILGKTAAQLTDAEKKQAFLNSVMKSGQDIVDRVGKSSLTAADAQAMFTAKMQDMSIIAGKVIITVSAGLTGVAFSISKVFAQMLKTAATALAKLDQLMSNLPFFKATPGIQAFADVQGAAADEAGRLASESFEVATAIWAEKEAVEGLTKARVEAATVLDTEEVSNQFGPDALGAYESFLMQKVSLHEAAQRQIMASEAGTYLSTITASQSNLVAMEQYHQNRVMLAMVSGATQTEIARINAENEVGMEKAKNDAKIALAANHLRAAAGFMQNLFIATGSTNKKMFEASKAFSIGQAVMNTYTGATRAFAQYGWPYGAVAAALVIAQGLAQVQQIRSQTMGGGVSGGGISGGGGSPTPQTIQPTGAGSLIGTQGQGPGQQAQAVTINVVNPLGTEDWDRIAEEEIMPAINRAGDRNVQLQFNTTEAV